MLGFFPFANLCPRYLLLWPYYWFTFLLLHQPTWQCFPAPLKNVDKGVPSPNELMTIEPQRMEMVLRV